MSWGAASGELNVLVDLRLRSVAGSSRSLRRAVEAVIEVKEFALRSNSNFRAVS